MADPRFPDVPNTLGVPPVRRDGPFPPGVETALAKQFSDLDAIHNWGIYTQAGALVIEPDNITEIEYAIDYRIADYPLEAGKFETYDKVTMPFEVRVTMTKGGTLTERSDFLKTLESLQGKLDLYNVVTPEKTYLNVNIAHVGNARTADRGATLLTVEVQLREIRQTATLAYSKSPPPAPAAPTPAQDTRPPTTSPGTTRKPAAARRISNGAAQPKQAPRLPKDEEQLIISQGALLGRTVTFETGPQRVVIGRGGI